MGVNVSERQFTRRLIWARLIFRLTSQRVQGNITNELGSSMSTILANMMKHEQTFDSSQVDPGYLKVSRRKPPFARRAVAQVDLRACFRVFTYCSTEIG